MMRLSDWLQSLSASKSFLPALIQDLDFPRQKPIFNFLERLKGPHEGVPALDFFCCEVSK